MGSSSPSFIPAEFQTALQSHADADGYIRFDHFMAVALYHPQLGYYCREQARVGRSDQTDFYTASSLGPVFGELVIACCVTQLEGRDPANFQFVEYGAEAGRSVLDGCDHPFAGVSSIGIGDSLPLAGSLIVFSNELFDAQPCRRLVRGEDTWFEIGVQLEQGRLREVRKPLSNAPTMLPPDTPRGYALDLPLAAVKLTNRIADQKWQGLFMAFDYGKSWVELSRETPQGTVRAYHQHRQSNQLLEHVGQQDLTCHVCWDWLSDALTERHFSVNAVLSQEAFLVKNAGNTLARIMQEEAGAMSPRKSGLMQILHPSALGQKFQVLSAWRDEL